MEEDIKNTEEQKNKQSKPLVNAHVAENDYQDENFSPTNTEYTPSEVMFLPPKNQWQEYSVWRVSTFRSSLYVSYAGKEDGLISLRGNILRNVLTSLENDHETTQQKLTYQFQVFNNQYISKAINNRTGTQNEGTVPFRFIRANLQSKNVVLFQNTFTIKPNTLQIDKLMQTVAIRFKYSDIMSPLIHISTPSINTKFKEDIVFENDVD